ncbi:hypothetical protein [Peribacillus simplex]|uniref:hypothetical protein n=1 Tax=Peribacillus simplex TaxID=1478 RepID=UPI0024C19C39|nr:hypothetical protein [Peribacillus simplex]WHY96959.1 hypothetical protein QNH37_23825 [Peribacillus simplex]
MAIQPFQRLVSNTSSVRLGADRDQAALNAANNMGDTPTSIMHAQVPVWASLKKFDNDTTVQTFSPFGGLLNPEYIWDQPTSEGQTVAFAIAAPIVGAIATPSDFSVVLVAFADNAMEAKIELFELIGDTFVKAAPQPAGLDEFLLVAGEPNMPAEGLTETQPFNWQDIRVYSTVFTSPPNPDNTRRFRIVVSFEVTNYLVPNPPQQPNPAGLQFMVDIYRNILGS